MPLRLFLLVAQPDRLVRLAGRTCDILHRPVEDVCKVGDKMWVKVIAVDDRGRIKLSRKAAMAERDAAAQQA